MQHAIIKLVPAITRLLQAIIVLLGKLDYCKILNKFFRTIIELLRALNQ